jgi:hypothetical protein
MRTRLLFVFLLLLECCSKPSQQQTRAVATSAPAESKKSKVDAALAPPAANSDDLGYTDLAVHDVIFHTTSAATLRVKWLRARMYPTKKGTYPSFDDTNSFRLEVQEGLIGMNLNDLQTLVNGGALKGSSLKNVKIAPAGRQLKISGTLHKVVPLPVQILADISASPDGKSVRLHLQKISVMKMPVKGLLEKLHIQTADLFDPNNSPGVSVSGDNVDLDLNELLPPPHTLGRLTDVRIWKTGDLMEYYGTPRPDAYRIKQWRNFMRLRGGTVNFGKLTMHNTDLLLVDTSQSDWLNFDVVHYQEQLVNGQTHITPEAGLEIFVPDINKIPRTEANRQISLQWMKNRNVNPPPDITTQP